MVAIDPRNNGTARQVEAQWVPIRPGTDGALALSMIQVLIEEELFDEQFQKNWTVGFEDLAQLVQHYRPEVVAEVCQVPAQTIRSLARQLASARGACPIMYSGLEYSDSGVQAIRAVLTLWALAGQLDVVGGLNIRMKDNLFAQNRTGLIKNPDVRKALGRDRFPVYSAYRGESHAIALPDSVLRGEPYRIRGLLVLGASIITAWPQPELWRRTLSGLDFLVCIDRYHTADSAYADVVLPATTQYEITSFMRYGSMFKIREKVIEPVGQSRSDYLILAELANRLGYGHLYPQTEEQVLEHALAQSGYSLEQVREMGGSVQLPGVMMQYKKWEKGLLRPDGKPGFNTPSGKFEIRSSVLAEHGYDPLPVYTEPQEGPVSRPDLAKRYPLVFGSGTRTLYDFRSQHHGVTKLSDSLREPNLIINTQDAKVRGIDEGDWVWVETQRGRVRYRASLTDNIFPGTIDAQAGGGGPLGPKAWRECNVNQLTDLERFDPISGFPIYKTLLCEVTKAEGKSDLISGRKADQDSELWVEPTVWNKPTRQVYLDHNATTPVEAEVFEAMVPYLKEEAGNPSSIHSSGNRARKAVEASRRKLAQLINATSRRVVFCGSGSEANNLALWGSVGNGNKKRHIVISAVEHPSVSQSCQALVGRGFDVSLLPVDSLGQTSQQALCEMMREDTALVSVMMANNEVGTIQPVADLAACAHEHGALFHTDCVQALGKIPIDVDQLQVDMLTVSAHKIGGPKGVGALFVRKDVSVEPLVYGGGQEWGMRSGTENVAGIVGFGKACELAQQRLMAAGMDRVRRLRDRLQTGLIEQIDTAVLNGHPTQRLPNTLNLTLPGIRGESLVLALDRQGVYFSSGSACKSGQVDPSPALLAMGLTSAQAHCAVRFSLGYATDEQDIEDALSSISQVLRTAFASVRFVACR